jgi:hypothetical protein
LKKYQRVGLILLVVGLISLGLWVGGVYVVYGGFKNYTYSTLGFGAGQLVYIGFASLMIIGIIFTIIGPVYMVLSSPNLDKKQKRGMKILIIGGIIILICVGIAAYVQSTVSVPLTSLGGGLGMIPFIMFVAIGSIVLIIGLAMLVSATVRKKKKESVT